MSRLLKFSMGVLNRSDFLWESMGLVKLFVGVI